MQVPMSPGGDALDAERVEYFRAGADYAEMVSRGADLRCLVDGSDYALAFELAQLVPALSGTTPVLTVPELHDLVERLGSDEPRSARARAGAPLPLAGRDPLRRQVPRPTDSAVLARPDRCVDGSRP